VIKEETIDVDTLKLLAVWLGVPLSTLIQAEV